MKPIANGELRLSRLCPAHRYPGDTDVWHHPTCMFTKTLQYPLYPKDMQEIEDLEEKDCEALLELFRIYGAEEEFESEEHEGLLVDFKNLPNLKCTKCEDSIDAESLKLGLYVRPPKSWVNQSVTTEWFHSACFFEHPNYEKFGVNSIRQFGGFNSIKKTQRENLKNLISAADNPKKRRKLND